MASTSTAAMHVASRSRTISRTWSTEKSPTSTTVLPYGDNGTKKSKSIRRNLSGTVPTPPVHLHSPKLSPMSTTSRKGITTMIRTTTVVSTTSSSTTTAHFVCSSVSKCAFLIGMALFLSNAMKMTYRMTNDLEERKAAISKEVAMLTIAATAENGAAQPKQQAPRYESTQQRQQLEQQQDVTDYRQLYSDSEKGTAFSYESYDNYASPGEEPYNFKEVLEGDHNVKKGQHPPWALFYNVFIPVDVNDTETQITAMKIVQEQLHQLSFSYAARQFDNFSLPIFYNNIGREVKHGFLKSTCIEDDNLECHNMNNYPAGTFEDVTLQRAWEYCHQFPHHQIIYMHSKGTYNSRQGKNDWWRRHMTYAVTHEMCLNPPLYSNATKQPFYETGSPPRCDMCGLVFNPQPWIHFSGNFFTAQCSYINKLLPLPVYRRKMEHLAVISRAHKNASRFHFSKFPDYDAYMGLDRYASESWPGSHPELQACDISRARNVNQWKKRRVHIPEHPEVDGYLHTNVSELMNFSFAPRLKKELHGIPLYTLDVTRNIKEDRMREYWFLAGNLLKWMYLYNHTLPPRQSWVWEFFADGDEWRQLAYQYQQQGPEALIYAALEDYAKMARNGTTEEIVKEKKREKEEEDKKKEEEKKREKEEEDKKKEEEKKQELKEANEEMELNKFEGTVKAYLKYKRRKKKQQELQQQQETAQSEEVQLTKSNENNNAAATIIKEQESVAAEGQPEAVSEVTEKKERSTSSAAVSEGYSNLKSLRRKKKAVSKKQVEKKKQGTPNSATSSSTTTTKLVLDQQKYNPGLRAIARTNQLRRDRIWKKGVATLLRTAAGKK